MKSGNETQTTCLLNRKELRKFFINFVKTSRSHKSIGAKISEALEKVASESANRFLRCQRTDMPKNELMAKFAFVFDPTRELNRLNSVYLQLLAEGVLNFSKDRKLIINA